MAADELPSPLRVVLISGDGALADRIGAGLEALGHAVERAATVAGGVERCRATGADVAVLDDRIAPEERTLLRRDPDLYADDDAPRRTRAADRRRSRLGGAGPSRHGRRAGRPARAGGRRGPHRAAPARARRAGRAPGGASPTPTSSPASTTAATSAGSSTPRRPAPSRHGRSLAVVARRRSTASSRSTTSTATTPATACWPPSPSAWALGCARRTCWAAGAARSSSSSCRTRAPRARCTPPRTCASRSAARRSAGAGAHCGSP